MRSAMINIAADHVPSLGGETHLVARQTIDTLNSSNSDFVYC